ncbi:MAG: response regulator [Gammaproteobacteria bacterium]|nr:response regulator [Gammaproteobacteria bacterium]
MVEKLESNNGRPNILVVDDSRVVRVSVTRVLEHEFNVHQADDGKAGLAFAKNLKPNLVVTDIMMPNLDGYGLICALRGHANPHVSDAPIIVITGAEEEYVRERAYACGANAFITKPFNPHTFLNSVRKHLVYKNASTAELRAKYDERIMSIDISDIPEEASEDMS